MLFDQILCVLTILCAVACCVIHIITSPSHVILYRLPPLIRFGVFVSAATFLYRGINFGTLSQIPPDGITVGHANDAAVLCVVAVSFTLAALAWWASINTYRYIKFVAVANSPSATAAPRY